MVLLLLLCPGVVGRVMALLPVLSHLLRILK
jgi:hypothetical protein